MDIWYTAVFVKDPDELIRVFPPKHENIFAHHSTIAFEPKSLDGIEVGKRWKIKVLGRAIDDKGDALLVENSKSRNKYPHITLSCKDGIGPVYSNKLLEKSVEAGSLAYFRKPFFVEGIEGYEDHQGKIFI